MSKPNHVVAAVAFALLGLAVVLTGWSGGSRDAGGPPAAVLTPTAASSEAGACVRAAFVRHRAPQGELEIAKIYFEYNSSANDLGVHVSLDGEDWKSLEIKNPGNQIIFSVTGKQGYAQLGMTELFFEGAEPSLNEFPLADLLALFPEGDYQFKAKSVGGGNLTGTGTLSHAIPAGPVVSATTGPGNQLVISWTPVTMPPPGFPNRPITIAGYQVIVSDFQVTVPGTATSVTVSPEYVASLAAGTQPYEVLAIDASGNQTITEGTFVH
jgi:hypothetical protein